MFWSKGRQQHVQDIFGEFVRPELIEAGAVLKKHPPPLNELTQTTVTFILLAVDRTTPARVGRNLGAVTEIARDAGWYVDLLFANVAVLFDRVMPTTTIAKPSASDLAKRIQTALGSEVKSLYGAETMPWGAYGGERRRAFGAMIPHFLEKVTVLHRQAYGTHVEHTAR
jgi:hypothetical protein